LRAAYPKSVWLDDADALEVRDTRRKNERVSRSRDTDSPHDEREAEALMALDALIAGGNAKAVPMLQRVLAGSHTDRVKSRAMFVLTQIDPAAADSAIDTIISGDASPRLKSEAIRMIAAGGRASSLDRLLPVYRSSDDKAVRRGVLDAFLIGDRADRMLQVIELEAAPRRREDAIVKLGAMGARDALKTLYAARTDAADRRAILRGLGVAGDGKALAAVASSEADPTLRSEAIRSIGMAGGTGAGDAIAAFYQPGQPEALRRRWHRDAVPAADRLDPIRGGRHEGTSPSPRVACPPGRRGRIRTSDAERPDRRAACARRPMVGDPVVTRR
jgi:HEAT repeat protein